MTWTLVNPHKKDTAGRHWKLQIAKNGKYQRAYIVIPQHAPFRSGFVVGQSLAVNLAVDTKALQFEVAAGGVQIVAYLDRVRFNVSEQIASLGLALPVGTFLLPDPSETGAGYTLDLASLAEMLHVRELLASSHEAVLLDNVHVPTDRPVSGWKVLVSPNGKHERAMLVIPSLAANRAWFDGVEQVVVTANLERKLLAVRPARAMEAQTVKLSKHGSSLKVTLPATLKQRGVVADFSRGTHDIGDPMLVGETLVIPLVAASK